MKEEKKIVIGEEAFKAFLDIWKKEKAGTAYGSYNTVVQFLKGALGSWKSGVIYPDAGQKCLDVDFKFFLQSISYLRYLSNNCSKNLNKTFASIFGLIDTIEDPDGDYFVSKYSITSLLNYVKNTILTDEDVAQIYEYAMGFTDVPAPDAHIYNAFHDGNSIKVLANEIKGSQPQTDKVIQIIKETFNIN